jgi:hypothetical protein
MEFVEIVRQGDVLLVKTDSGQRKTRKKASRVILAEGESTGHAHVVEAVPLEIDGVMWIVAPSEVPVRHEEHSPALIDVGEWIVGAQAEYEPGDIRRVSD